MGADEDNRGHSRYPSATMSSEAAVVVSYASHSNPVRRAEEAEMDEMVQAGGSVPDEERGIDKPVLPKSIKEIWREDRRGGDL